MSLAGYDYDYMWNGLITDTTAFLILGFFLVKNGVDYFLEEWKLEKQGVIHEVWRKPEHSCDHCEFVFFRLKNHKV